MKKIKAFSTIIAICVFLMGFSPITSYAAESDVSEVYRNDHADVALENEIKVNGYDEVSEVNSSDIFDQIESPNDVCKENNLRSGDQYETNDSFTQATTGMTGTKLHATIHDISDMDYFKIEVLDTSEYYSFVLMDIPSGCDYQMVVVDDTYNGWANFSSGNAYEFFTMQFDSTGTYYVIIYSASGYSDTPYTLYYGKSFKNGSTGWMNPNFVFSFGNVPHGGYNELPAQILDLTNDSTIPTSVLTQLYVSTHGNGGSWAGFTKYVQNENYTPMSIIGNLEAFNVPDMTYYTKSQWKIWGSVQYSQYFTWTPQILMGYKYIVTPQTMSFLP